MRAKAQVPRDGSEGEEQRLHAQVSEEMTQASVRDRVVGHRQILVKGGRGGLPRAGAFEIH